MKTNYRINVTFVIKGSYGDRVSGHISNVNTVPLNKKLFVILHICLHIRMYITNQCMKNIRSTINGSMLSELTELSTNEKQYLAYNMHYDFYLAYTTEYRYACELCYINDEHTLFTLLKFLLITGIPMKYLAYDTVVSFCIVYCIIYGKPILYLINH